MRSPMKPRGYTGICSQPGLRAEVVMSVLPVMVFGYQIKEADSR